MKLRLPAELVRKIMDPSLSGKWVDALRRARKTLLEMCVGYGKFLQAHGLQLGLTVLFLFFWTTLKALVNDGRQVFEMQKEALTVQVFARTDLLAEEYPVLEEKLRALETIKSVESFSPESALKQLSADPELSDETQWLREKMSALKKKDTVLPWVYRVTLNRWDDESLAALVQKINVLDVGAPKKPAVMKVYFDQDRLTLVSALNSYINWAAAVLKAGIALMLVLLAAFLFQFYSNTDLRNAIEEDRWRLLNTGLLSGFICHLLSIWVVSSAFFGQGFPWETYLGRPSVSQLAIGVLWTVVGYTYSQRK